MQNLNINPYYDDFDESKGFHQILFKPGIPVQARELTQLQTILRNQIEKFGSHVFKHGSVVIPGNIRSDLTICYVKLQTNAVNLSEYIGKTVTSSTGLRGYIRAVIDADGSDPDTLYVNYYNSGSSGQQIFGNGELLTLGTDIGAPTVLTAVSTACGGAAMAFINEGVFFVNGTFVTVLKQSAVISKYSNVPSCHVLLQIAESIVDSTEDATLLDPAQGSYNYAAPGADRLQISLNLISLPLNTTISDDYIELMRYNEGVLEEHLRYPKYNELEKSLARRTYDESGNYVVEGLNVSAREHLRSTVNNGRYSSDEGGNIDKMIYNISPGKAYIQGYENEKIANSELIVDKARTNDHVKNASISAGVSYGQYLYVTNIVNLPDFVSTDQLSLYNSSSGGVVIGTATIVAMDYVEPNTTDSNAIFKIFLSNITMTGGNTVAAVGRATFTNGTGGSFVVLSKMSVVSNNPTDFVLNEVITSSTRVATVHKYIRSTGTLYVHKHTTGSVPVTGDTITAPSTASAKIIGVEVLGKNVTDNLIVDLNSLTTKSVKNASNVVDMSYKIYYTTTVTCVSGAASFSVTGMTIDPKEQGNFIVASAAGIHPLSTVTVAPDGLSVSFAGISPTTAVLRIVCAATKLNSNASPKTKTLSSQTTAGLTPASTITLTKADGVKLTSVVSTVDGNVTDRYSFFSGTTDYAYLRSYLKLKTGSTLPTGTLTVIYQYFNHNVGSGDYFCVDSYTGSGLTNYFSNPVLQYKSANTGKTYDLRNCLDFRPRVGEDGTFTDIGASVNRLPQVDSRITTSIQEYVGRIDAIVFDKDGVFRAVQGTPDKNAHVPAIPVDSLHLANINVPAYTYNITDINIDKQNNKVFTMKDIGTLETRVENLEEYVTLTQTESSAVDYEVIDATTGLSRYKSGYLVDSFQDPDKISDVYSDKFKVAYASENIIPMFEVIEAPLVITGSTGQTTNNQVVTLPYTHVVMANQPISSRVTNINPFSVFSWVGVMRITPASDSWTETTYLPDIINNVTNTTTKITYVTETVTIPRPWTWVPSAGTNVTRAPAPTVVSTTRNIFPINRNRK